MHQFMEPDGVAIIGASQDFTTINGKILKYLLKHHYQGAIYPVNPKYQKIAGLACYTSVGDIPGNVDLVLIAVSAVRVPDILRECGARGVRAAIIFSSGFAETGVEGKKLQEAVKTQAKEQGIRLLGPNCLGILNVARGLMASFSGSLEVDQVRLGPVSLVSQSGAVGFMLFNLLQEAGVGINYVVTTGNEVDLTVGEGLEYVVHDPGTRVILTYLEGVRDGESFRRTAEAAAELGKPIIALKVGHSSSGQKAAATHTAALTGSEAAYRSYFGRMGILEARDSEDIVDLAQAFLPGKLPRGARVGIVTMSGGVGILLADRSEEAGLIVPELSPKLQRAVAKVIPAFGSPLNPVDVTAQSLNQGDEFKECLQILLASEEIDLLIVAITMATGEMAAKIGQDIAEAALGTDKPLLVSWSVGQVAKLGFEALAAAGVPLYHSPARAAKAAGALNHYAVFRRGWQAPRREPMDEERRGDVLRMLAAGPLCFGERATKEILKRYRLPMTEEYLATTVDEAVTWAEKIGYPLVMKVDSPDIMHKTEAGGVVLHVASPEDVRTKFEEIMKKAKVYAPQARIQGVLIQEEVPPGVEVIVGLQKDPVLGSQILFGLGGIFVEVLQDAVLRPLPLRRQEARAMLNEIKGAAMLNGVRGYPPVDKEALVDILMGVSQLAGEAEDQILSLDLNPVAVLPQGQGAKVLDGVLVKLRQ